MKGERSKKKDYPADPRAQKNAFLYVCIDYIILLDASLSATLLA